MKNEIKIITQEFGYDALFLPPYSQDLNSIQQDMLIMKKEECLLTQKPLVMTLLNYMKIIKYDFNTCNVYHLDNAL